MAMNGLPYSSRRVDVQTAQAIFKSPWDPMVVLEED